MSEQLAQFAAWFWLLSSYDSAYVFAFFLGRLVVNVREQSKSCCASQARRTRLWYSRSDSTIALPKTCQLVTPLNFTKKESLRCTSALLNLWPGTCLSDLLTSPQNFKSRLEQHPMSATIPRCHRHVRSAAHTPGLGQAARISSTSQNTALSSCGRAQQTEAVGDKIKTGSNACRP